jgi:hypothetical protein
MTDKNFQKKGRKRGESKDDDHHQDCDVMMVHDVILLKNRIMKELNTDLEGAWIRAN